MISRVALSRALAFRGVTTSAVKKDFIYYPGYMMSVEQHKQFLEHPNRNPDNYESFLIPYPQAPKFADKDPELNALRAKSMADWSAMSTEEVNALYDGHFKYRYYRYQQPTDRWKFYTGMVFLNLGLACCMLRVFFWAEGHSHPEYYSDPHFLTEYIKRGLQINAGHLRGLSTHWNYQKGEWNEEKPFYYWFFPHNVSPRESGQLGFSKWQK